MIFEYETYTEFLKAVLLERQNANPAYSLRAMAMSLDLSPSTLSDVINRRKRFSEQTADEVARRLKLGTNQRRYFVTLVQFESANNEEMKQILLAQLRALNPKLREHVDVDMDQFRLIADWHHWVILELTFLEQQKMDPRSIAESLEIPEQQALDSINLLTKLGLLQKISEDRYKKTQTQFKFQSPSKNLALRKFHHQMLAKAQASLHTQTPQEKLIGSETIPLNPADLNEANDIIESCFQRILELSKRSQKRSHVYHLGIQFFQTTKRADIDKPKRKNS